jgi:hypothetical protein
MEPGNPKVVKSYEAVPRAVRDDGRGPVLPGNRWTDRHISALNRLFRTEWNLTTGRVDAVLQARIETAVNYLFKRKGRTGRGNKHGHNKNFRNPYEEKRCT